MKIKGLRMNWTVKRKLVLALTGLLIIPALLIGIMSYLQAENELEARIKDSARDSVGILNRAITDALAPKVHDAGYFGAIVNKRLAGDEATVLQKLTQYVDLHPEATNAFVGTEGGAMILAPAQELPADYDPRTRPWYEDALKADGKTVITDPYYDASTGDATVTVAKALDDGSGVFGIDIKLEKLKELTLLISVGDNGYAFMLDKSGHYIVHPSEKPGDEAKDAFAAKFYDEASGVLEAGQGSDTQLISYETNELTGWKIAGSMLRSEVSAATRPILIVMGAVIAGALLVGSCVIILLVRSITRPLKRMNELAGAIASGDLTARLEGLKRDEFGELGNSLNEMSERLRMLIQGVNLNAMQLAASAEQLSAGADQTSRATEVIVEVIQEVASGTERQVHMMDRSTASLRESASSAAEVARQAQSASSAAEQSSEISREGGAAVERAMREMEMLHATFDALSVSVSGLGERSTEIGRITQLIAAIASQTQLLALNASIESARVGEHGRGFAVIAGEVRNLAEQSAQASKQVDGLISVIQTETNRTVDVMRQAASEVAQGMMHVHTASEKFSHIQASTTEAAGQIRAAAAAVDAITGYLAQVKQSVDASSLVARETSGGTHSVSASTEEQLAQMEEMTSSAAALSQMAEELQELIGKFKV
ncbi:methyl-accepting chemotaxis protein [Paenibacillus aurantiacus]|uniref:Methyl-accepting chemotaxis protein n=1 Tax=Paenibacillus aurantiacus TaxID=1936118 RepID=A0ABV5KKG0_9BACL